ncbi:MAG: type II CAAX endopeptidase family protein [Myxococcota bacterium]
MRLLVLGLGLVLALAGLFLGVRAVRDHEGVESGPRGPAQTLAALEAITHRQLVVAPIAPGASMLLEACAEDAFEDPAWAEVVFDVWVLEGGHEERARSVPGAEVKEAVRRAPDGSGCATVASAEGLPFEGEVALGLRGAGEGDATPPADLAELRVRGLAKTWRPVGDGDGLPALLLGLGALALVLGWLLPAGAGRRAAFDALAGELEAPAAGAASPPAPWRRLPEHRRALSAAAFFVLALFALELLPGLVGGSVLPRGGAIAGLQVGLAVLLGGTLGRVAGSRDLGLVAPTGGTGRRLAFLLAAPLAGLGLVVLGRVLAGLVPSTGVAPVETLVTLPSGSLAFGLYALFAPLAEELFFRGFLYGALERRYGANVATGVVIALFALVHLGQSFGAWGAFLSVTVTGALLTLLRRWSGSVLVPALAHLAHNGVLTLQALL